MQEEQNEIVENEVFVNISNSEKLWIITKKIIDYSSIFAAYIGIFLILSYPILHITNAFCNIENFMKVLPLGYTTNLQCIESDSLAIAPIIIWGIVSFFVAFKLFLWLFPRHSITSRIFCFLLGSGYMYLMIDKGANAVLFEYLNLAFALILIFFVGIPFLIFVHNNFFPVLKGVVPSVFTYYKFLLSFLPNTTEIMNCFDEIKKYLMMQIHDIQSNI